MTAVLVALLPKVSAALEMFVGQQIPNDDTLLEKFLSWLRTQLSDAGIKFTQP